VPKRLVVSDAVTFVEPPDLPRMANSYGNGTSDIFEFGSPQSSVGPQLSSPPVSTLSTGPDLSSPADLQPLSVHVGHSQFPNSSVSESKPNVPLASSPPPSPSPVSSDVSEIVSPVSSDVSETVPTRVTRSSGGPALQWSKLWGAAKLDPVPVTHSQTGGLLGSSAISGNIPRLIVPSYLTVASRLNAESAWEIPAWRDAMKIELKSFTDLDTFDEVKRPSDHPVVKGRWLFAEKRTPTGKLEKFKARYVAKGFTQVYGMDFTTTWCPTIKPQVIRILFALAARQGKKLRHLDVEAAFLNAPLKETIYIEKPFGAAGTGEVWRLKKALYGLKQAGRAWYVTLVDMLKDLGLRQCVSEPCLFVGNIEGSQVYIGFHVDDLLMLTSTSSQADIVIRPPSLPCRA
jgi:hypothetical protein